MKEREDRDREREARERERCLHNRGMGSFP